MDHSPHDGVSNTHVGGVPSVTEVLTPRFGQSEGCERICHLSANGRRASSKRGRASSGAGDRDSSTRPPTNHRDDRFPLANEGCGEVRHVPPAPDAREREEIDGTARSSRGWSRLVAGSGLVACRRRVLEPDAALRTQCLQRNQVEGSSPAEPDRQGPHEAGRSKLALFSSSAFLELETLNKDPAGPFSFWVCVSVCGPVLSK